ncbi:helix-turn-helix domain-containing protein [Cupriavidus sp. USMAHM13]|uniref:helix-turn-helix domain-containing protein n=1 Tax=Cupriavidus sp. USMAHM13 TaxID=1389192 RepID=UPI000AE95FCB|nr:helix-turn-helix domain-containing protein [Cupriavidus sp. USMAHM13]
MQPLDPMPSPHATRLTVSSFDQWREIIDTRFLPLDYARESHGRFHCEVSYARFGACAVADMQVSAHRVARLRRHAEDSDAGFFKVFWQLHGRSRVAQREHQAALDPGMWTLYDTAQPYSIELDDGARAMVLLVPQDQAYGWRDAATAMGGQAQRGEGAARIAMSALGALLHDSSTGHPLDAHAQRVLQDSVVALMETALRSGGSGGQPALAPSRADEARLQRIHELVDARLHEPELSAQHLAAALNISRRTLYNLFREIGQTPHAYIQSRRLRQAALRLAQDGGVQRSITEVAFALGFADAAHFSRVFHERFGMSPSQWRQRHAATRA